VATYNIPTLPMTATKAPAASAVAVVPTTGQLWPRGNKTTS
jgi:hypothetical protein